MKIIISKPEYLSSEGLKEVLLKGGPHSKFIGSWAVKTKSGSWSDYPVDIIYVPNPEITGFPGILTAYWTDMFGVGYKGNAETSFKEALSVLVEDGVIYVSKFRHDFVKTPKGLYIDGGRDYTKVNTPIFNSLQFDFIKGNFMITNERSKCLSEVEIEYDFN